MRALLLWLSRQRWLRRWMEQSPRAAVLTSRFVAGRRLEDALRVTAQLNQRGISTTLDYLGESVTTTEEAAAARDVYLRLLDEIERRGFEANISVKLTQLGIDVSQQACHRNVEALACRPSGTFVRVDMESSAYTDRTLELVRDLHARGATIGAVIQACLYRSEADVAGLIGRGVRVRLCKGAYREPPLAAFPGKSDVDANFAKLARRLLKEGRYPALATHDERLLHSVVRFAEANGISKDAYEIQMLYGLRRGLRARLVRQGHRVRVYVPFGDAWYPYLMRRLAERPANLWFVVRSVLQG